MKGFTIGIEVLAAVIIAIAVLTWGVSFILEGEIQTSADGDSSEFSACEFNSDCALGQLCISINGGDYFCGCLEDDDCTNTGEVCINNECQRVS